MGDISNWTQLQLSGALVFWWGRGREAGRIYKQAMGIQGQTPGATHCPALLRRVVDDNLTWSQHSDRRLQIGGDIDTV